MKLGKTVLIFIQAEFLFVRDKCGTLSGFAASFGPEEPAEEDFDCGLGYHNRTGTLFMNNRVRRVGRDMELRSQDALLCQPPRRTCPS